MKTRHKRLIKVGKTDVRNAMGFFWHDRHKIYVAASPSDIDEWRARGSFGMGFSSMSWEVEDGSVALVFESYSELDME